MVFTNTFKNVIKKKSKLKSNIGVIKKKEQQHCVR